MLWIAGQLWQERSVGSPSGRPQHAGNPHSLDLKKIYIYATVVTKSWFYGNDVQLMFNNNFGLFH